MGIPDHNSRDETANHARAAAGAEFLRRKDRRRCFPSPLFAEYGWDVLLLLFSEENSRASQKVTHLAERVSAPITTAVRWLNYLEQRNLIDRQVSDVDRREVLISLTDVGRKSMLSYFGTNLDEGVERT